VLSTRHNEEGYTDNGAIEESFRLAIEIIRQSELLTKEK